jgi:hypothetical protein
LSVPPESADLAAFSAVLGFGGNSFLSEELSAQVALASFYSQPLVKALLVAISDMGLTPTPYSYSLLPDRLLEGVGFLARISVKAALLNHQSDLIE